MYLKVVAKGWLMYMIACYHHLSSNSNIIIVLMELAKTNNF